MYCHEAIKNDKDTTKSHKSQLYVEARRMMWIHVTNACQQLTRKQEVTVALLSFHRFSLEVFHLLCDKKRTWRLVTPHISFNKILSSPQINNHDLHLKLKLLLQCTCFFIWTTYVIFCINIGKELWKSAMKPMNFSILFMIILLKTPFVWKQTDSRCFFNT